MANVHTRATLLSLIVSGCIVTESSDSARKPADKAAVSTPAPAPAIAMVADSQISVPTDDSASLDTTGLGSQMDSLPPLSTDTAYKRITATSAGATLTKFPARIPNRGAATFQLQILLDRAGFSPGTIDGNWGPNAAKALKWFRVANGMDSVTPGRAASIDRETYQKLVAAGQTTPLVTTYEVTPDDMEGPFIQIPNSVYDQAKLDCLCYSSPAEELAEKFHTSEQTLRQLNPRVNLKSVAAGTSLQVPNVGENSPTSSGVAKLIISTKGYWTHAVDASGNILAHFPSTLGAGYDPSPTGEFRVTYVAQDPAFHYQPSLMAEVPDTRPTARLKPGPNSPVGTIWIALSKPHYGIHGTSSPETIGYANSHGCVRLTNWDAERLGTIVRAGTPVEFQ